MRADKNLTGKVAAVVNDREVVLNVGSDDGVEVGMRFAILVTGGVEIRDPDTEQLLGTTELTKAVVKVTRVDGPHLSAAQTFRVIPGRRGAFEAYLPHLVSVPDRTESLEVEQHDTLEGELEAGRRIVARGDDVRLLRAGEHEE